MVTKGQTTFIYALKDPRDDSIRYVGKSNDPVRRLKGHVSGNTNGFVAGWIEELAKTGKEPSVAVLQEVDKREWREAERAWIRHCLTKDCDLLNVTDGPQAKANPWWTIFVTLPPKAFYGYKELDFERQRLIGCSVAEL